MNTQPIDPRALKAADSEWIGLDEIPLQKKSLEIVAKHRKQHGDKTVHDDIMGAIRTIEMLEKKVAESVNGKLLEAIPFPATSACSANALAYEIECGFRATVTTSAEAKAAWLRDIAKQLRAFDEARSEAIALAQSQPPSTYSK